MNNKKDKSIIYIWLVSDAINVIQAFKKMEGLTDIEKYNIFIKLVIRLLIKFSIRNALQNQSQETQIVSVCIASLI